MTRRSRNESVDEDDANAPRSVLRRIFVQRRQAPNHPPSTDIAPAVGERLNGSFTVQMPAFDDLSVQFAPIGDGPATASSSADWLWDAPNPSRGQHSAATPDASGSPFVDRAATPPRPTPADRSAQSTPFPGGRPRLPRLDGSDTSTMNYVGAAFVRPGAHDAQPDAEPARGGFEEYFTYESLFDDVPESRGTDEDLGDPYRILGVRPTAAWSELQSAHRRLVKEFHPDRFVGHDDETIRRAEEEIRRINWAYEQLERSQGSRPDA